MTAIAVAPVFDFAGMIGVVIAGRFSAWRCKSGPVWVAAGILFETDRWPDGLMIAVPVFDPGNDLEKAGRLESLRGE